MNANPYGGNVAVNQDRPKTQTEGPRQFSLWGLMVFVTVFSLWCSQFAALRGLADDRGAFQPHGASVASVLLTWVVLSLFYYRRRLLLLFALQCIFPATNGLLAAIRAATVGQDIDAFAPLMRMMLIVNLAWFPVAMLTIIVRWWRRPIVTEVFPETGRFW
jgi:hypothetical protein